MTKLRWNPATLSGDYDFSDPRLASHGLLGLRDYELKDAHMELMGATLFRIPSLSFDTVISASELSLRLDAESIIVPRTLLEDIFTDYAGALPQDKEEWTFSLKTALKTIHEQDAAVRFTFDLNAGLAELGSAECRFVVTGEGPGTIIPIDTATPTFVSASIDLDDRGWGDLIFPELLGTDALWKSPAESRAQLSEGAVADIGPIVALYAGASTEKQKKVETALHAIAGFLGAPGQLRLSLRAEPPLPFWGLFFPDAYNLPDHLTPEAEFTPHAP